MNTIDNLCSDTKHIGFKTCNACRFFKFPLGVFSAAEELVVPNTSLIGEF